MSRYLAAVGAALALAMPVQSAAVDDTKLARLQARDAQLFAVGWRLATANAAYCRDAGPASGLAVLDAAGFGNPASVRLQLGLSGDLAVGAVAPGSPASAAGLRANDTLVALNDVPLTERFPSGKPSWQRLIDVVAALDAALARGPISLTYERSAESPRTLMLTGTPACRSRFEVLDSGGKAMAEGTRVIFGRDFPGFDYPEPEFAAAVAHEFAHNLLSHRRLLDEKGRSLGNVRLTEREADRLMPWLLANAGYDPAAALRFMQRWGPRHDGGLFRNRNHEGWDERADAIRTELVRVETARAADGTADWARHFVRESLD